MLHIVGRRPFALTATGQAVLERRRWVLHAVRDVRSVTSFPTDPRHYSIVKWASVVWPVRPLIGRMSCGHAENAITRSISALSTT